MKKRQSVLFGLPFGEADIVQIVAHMGNTGE